METIEQLQQNNAKLQERLNNAAKFFKEQKAQIESLTNEVKEKTELALDYRNQIESKDKAYKTLQETYNDVLAENKQLKEQTESGINNLEDLQKQLNEYELKLKDSETAYEQLHKKYDIRKNQIAELTGNIEVQKNEYELKLQNSKNTCEELQKTYNEVSTENTQLKEQIASMVIEATNMAEEYAKVTLSLENYKNENTTLKNDIKILNEDVIKQNQEIEKLQIEKSDLEVNINDLTSRLSESVNGKTKYQEFTEMIIGLVESFNNNGNNIDSSNHSSITVNTYKNSTGSQFMSDAPGMNI